MTINDKLKIAKRNVFLQKFTQGKHEISTEDLIQFLESYHGNYLAKMFIDEWRFTEDTSKIKKWEEEHGKSLALLFENESQKIMLSELNEKLSKAAEIYEKDMKMAATVQQSLLYEKPPQTTNYDIAFYYRPISSVSGDFYDFYVDDNNELTGLVLADVSGHGIASALLTTLAKPVFFKQVRDNPERPLGEIMVEVHEELVKEIEESTHYLTAALLRFPDNKVEYVNAAHPELIIKKAKDGSCYCVRECDESLSGPMIGLRAVSYEYTSYTFDIEKDDILLIYTDCLSESFNSKKEELGTDNIINILKTCSTQDVNEIIDILITELKKHTGTVPLNDDLSLIAVKKK